MPETPTLVDIAAAIRRHSPGAVPESIKIDSRIRLRTCGTIMASEEIDDIARHVLIAAMVMEMDAARDTRARHSGATWRVRCPKTGVYRVEHDKDHNNDPLLSLYAAWRWARGIA